MGTGMGVGTGKDIYAKRAYVTTKESKTGNRKRGLALDKADVKREDWSR